MQRQRRAHLTEGEKEAIKMKNRQQYADKKRKRHVDKREASDCPGVEDVNVPTIGNSINRSTKAAKHSASRDRKAMPKDREVVSGPLVCHALRLHPNEEISSSIVEYVRSNHLSSAFMMTCVGSVQRAHLRLADGLTTKVFEGPYEILSLVGTISGGEKGHLHISLSDFNGNVIGGHVMGDLIVHTTAEIVIGQIAGVKFSREDDPETGYDELEVHKS